MELYAWPRFQFRLGIEGRLMRGIRGATAGKCVVACGDGVCTLNTIIMKPRSLLIIGSAVALGTLGVIAPAAANPEIGTAMAKEFGDAAARNVVLVRAGANATDPVQWTVYSRDPHRAGKLVRSIVVRTDGRWVASPGGGDKALKRVPPRVVDLTKVGWNSRLARETAAKAAAGAQVDFALVDYQLAADEQTGEPEWGLALQDAGGYEVGFCVVSAETGVLKSQDWTPKQPAAGSRPPPTPESEGARAAKRVKAEVRRAWNWTEDAGRRTGGFFRELFRRD